MKILILLCILILSLNPQAKAGGVDGGGGVGVFCPGSDEKSSTFELLDLHEGRLRGLKFLSAPQTDDEVSELAANLIANHFWTPWINSRSDYIKVIKSEVINGMLNGKGIPGFKPGSLISITYVDSLPLSNDIGNYKIAPGCHLEQVAYFDDDKLTIFFAKKNWQDLNGLSRTALIVHELVYTQARLNSLDNAGMLGHWKMTSEISRQFVSSLLSTEGLLPKAYGLETNQYLQCKNIDPSDKFNLTDFFLYNSEKNEVTAVLFVNNGYYSPFLERVHLQGVQVNDFLNNASKDFEIKNSIQLVGQIDTPQFNFEITKQANANPTVQLTRVYGTSEVLVGKISPVVCDFRPTGH